jgi:hypothetical protein
MNVQKLGSWLRHAVFAGALCLVAGAASATVELQQGVNYKLLQPAQPTSVAPGKVEVVEVFWYACGPLLHARAEDRGLGARGQAGLC